jgi:hypothetical protein
MRCPASRRKELGSRGQITIVKGAPLSSESPFTWRGDSSMAISKFRRIVATLVFGGGISAAGAVSDTSSSTGSDRLGVGPGSSAVHARLLSQRRLQPGRPQARVCRMPFACADGRSRQDRPRQAADGTTTSGWLVFGGTSAAAPIVAGIFGVNAGVPLNGYAARLYNQTAHLFDVKSGSNGSCGGTYLCTGGTGYDGPSGLGTPNTPAAF